MTCFDCKVCFGSKFTSSAEGRRFNWLIYDSMTSLFACGRFSKSRGLSASVSFSFPSIHRPVILCSRTAQKRLLRRLRRFLTQHCCVKNRRRVTWRAGRFLTQHFVAATCCSNLKSIQIAATLLPERCRSCFV